MEPLGMVERGTSFPFLLMLQLLRGKVETGKRRSAANVDATSNENLQEKVKKKIPKNILWYKGFAIVAWQGENKEKEECSQCRRHF